MDDPDKELHWFEKLPEETRVMRNRRSNAGEKKNAQKGENMDNKIDVNVEKYVEDAERWIDEVSVYLKTDDRKDWAWNALRGVLHVIRDRVPPEEVFQLSAQFPMLIRGLFFEGYHLNNKPDKFHLDELEDRIEMSLGPAVDFKAETAFRAVLLVLYDHVSEGEMKDIYATLPKDIRQLWDKSLEKYTV